MDVEASLAQLVSALRTHADTVSSSDATEHALREASEAVRAAARRYSESSATASGGDGPFYDLELLSDDAPEGDDADAFAAAGTGDCLRVSGTWDFLVTDREAWTRYVARRLDGIGAAQDVRLSGDPAQAAAALLEFAGPGTCLDDHGLECVGDEWSVADSLDPLGEREEQLP
ncbi:hypothetical protein GCM10027074_52150 [Streptomyces deserti]